MYIQHRHNGDKAWIGLNDIATEGVFAWVDGCPFRFHYWAQNQPNNFREEDCVHTLGAGHGYRWNDVGCFSCHQYTCKKGNLDVFVLLQLCLKLHNGMYLSFSNNVKTQQIKGQTAFNLTNAFV